MRPRGGHRASIRTSRFAICRGRRDQPATGRHHPAVAGRYRAALKIDALVHGGMEWQRNVASSGRVDRGRHAVGDTLDPLSPFYQLVEGTVLLMSRRVEDAIRLYDQLIDTHPGDHALSTTRYVSPFHEGFVQLGLGDIDRALACLLSDRPAARGPRGLCRIQRRPCRSVLPARRCGSGRTSRARSGAPGRSPG